MVYTIGGSEDIIYVNYVYIYSNYIGNKIKFWLLLVAHIGVDLLKPENAKSGADYLTRSI